MLVEKYTPDPIRNVPTPTVSKITKMGRKNGRPRTRMPNRIGKSATDAAANGTVGTSKILAGGNLSGNDFVTDVRVELVAFDMESMMKNHDCASDTIAPISVRYGPDRHNLSRNVG